MPLSSLVLFCFCAPVPDIWGVPKVKKKQRKKVGSFQLKAYENQKRIRSSDSVVELQTLILRRVPASESNAVFLQFKETTRTSASRPCQRAWREKIERVSSPTQPTLQDGLLRELSSHPTTENTRDKSACNPTSMHCLSSTRTMVQVAGPHPRSMTRAHSGKGTWKFVSFMAILKM